MELKYAGMTVNERLWASGLMDQFDKAVEQKDVKTIRAILERVGLTEESIKPIIDQHGLH